jgi:hypothetical protein
VEVNPGIVHAWNPRLRQEYQEFRDSLETLLWGGKKKKRKKEGRRRRRMRKANCRQIQDIFNT